MFNLPFNSSIGGNAILHEGNHDKRGIPHEQYINKWNLNTTLDNKTNTNKFCKIAEIEYEEDNNTSCNYILEIVNSRDLTKIEYLYLSLGTRKSLKYNYNSSYGLWYKTTSTMQDNGKNKTKVEIYIQIYKSYNPIFYRIKVAKNVEVWNYDNDYAFKCITLLSKQPLLDTVDGIFQCEDTKPVRHFYKRQSWGKVSIKAGEKYQIVMDDSNIKWDSILSFTTSVEVPSELMYTVSVKDGGGSAIINIRNVSTIDTNFPECQLLLMITQSF